MAVAGFHLDTETRSIVDLKKAGLHRYFQDVTTECLCFAWCASDGQVFGQHNSDASEPAALLDHIENGGVVTAHNAAFDRTCWNAKVVKRHPTWPRLKIEQMSCTMARAHALSLPGGLAMLGEALKISMPKDLEGHKLMMKLCKPRSVVDGKITWWGTPEEFDRNLEYCKRDVAAEHQIDQILPQLTAAEHAVWVLDQHINERGVRLDLYSVEAALRVVNVALSRADDEMWKLTDGAVRKVSQGAKLIAWLRERGIMAESVAKSEEEEIIMMTDMFDDPVAEAAVRLRNVSNKTSTKKLEAMLRVSCADERSRGLLMYHKASTGRWAGMLWQPHNLKRVGDDGDDVDVVFDTLRKGRPDEQACDTIDMLTKGTLETVSKALRGMIVAAPGKKLIGGDFSNIEGRIAAWIAGEHWKVQAFRDYDTIIPGEFDKKGKPKRKGPDLYLVTAAAITGKPIETITGAERQSFGKVPELACGYQGGVGAFQTMARTQNPPVKVTDAEADHIKRMWRIRHPGIVDAWQDLIDSAFAAVEAPGVVVDCLGGKCRFFATKAFLYLKLPSQRVLAYSFPHIKWEERRDKKTGELVLRDNGEKIVDKVLYTYGVDSQKNKWSLQKLYGGLLFENAVSGTARDVLVGSMFRLEEAGYWLTLTVHDENLSEVDEDFGSAEEVKAIMEMGEKWTKGLPIAAATWEGFRYEK